MAKKDPRAITIQRAETPVQFQAGRQLISAYADFLGQDLEFQGFSAELDGLEQMYGPPTGALLLAQLNGDYIGSVGLRQLEPGIAEMKRLFVLEPYQGRGCGRALALAFIDCAKELGYRSVKLDSIPELDSALALYRAMGFYEIAPYRFNPHPEAVFMEYRLR